MDFTLTQDISGTVDQVEDALTDAGFLATMADLPKIGSAEVLEQTRDGDSVHQRVRYLFTADLSGAVRRVVDPDKLTWVEDSTSDLRAHTASYRIDPDNYANLLEGSYDATITATDSGARRVATGQLKVHVPLVGGKVEKAIVDGLQENSDAQAELLTAWIAAHP
jgi:hypothetical protein